MFLETYVRPIARNKQNFIFIGGAGSGKSEIAVNFARFLLAAGDKPVHFFDLDMTKPLFRSRDLVDEIEKTGIEFHYEEQFMDAPTVVGGVRRLLRDEDSYAVMDVGGDHIGARAIGGYAPLLNLPCTVVYYVINSFRPWSFDIEHIDRVMGEILGVSHVRQDQLRLVGNPNLGFITTAQDFLEGSARLTDMVAPYKEFDFFCAAEGLFDQVLPGFNRELAPLHLFLGYPWENSYT
jgi:hypothetical protein